MAGFEKTFKQFIADVYIEPPMEGSPQWIQLQNAWYGGVTVALQLVAHGHIEEYEQDARNHLARSIARAEMQKAEEAANGRTRLPQ